MKLDEQINCPTCNNVILLTCMVTNHKNAPPHFFGYFCKKCKIRYTINVSYKSKVLKNE